MKGENYRRRAQMKGENYRNDGVACKEQVIETETKWWTCTEDERNLEKERTKWSDRTAVRNEIACLESSANKKHSTKQTWTAKTVEP